MFFNNTRKIRKKGIDLFNYLPNKSIDDIFVEYDFDTHYGTLNSKKINYN